jgi:hypothetical protein
MTPEKLRDLEALKHDVTSLWFLGYYSLIDIESAFGLAGNKRGIDLSRQHIGTA